MIDEYYTFKIFGYYSDDLYNPIHLWLIPANKVNHLVGLTIRKNTVDKWSEYELSLDKVMVCCESLR